MKILVACEYSGIVRDAFCREGHDAWSCDILPTEGSIAFNHKHLQIDLDYVLDPRQNWDMIIAFPPCTFLSNVGNAWMNSPLYPNRKEDRETAKKFVRRIWNADAKYICIENPIGCLSTSWQKPTQYIQPYEFGHDATKKTCLWLKNLPKLRPTSDMTKEDVTMHTYKNGRRECDWFYKTSLLPHSQRSKARSKFWEGIADAMADQWSL
jgi:site-specific DNA-cytosine methylase